MPASHKSRRARATLGLISTSLVLSIVAIPLSMASQGTSTLYTAIVAGSLTLLYNVAVIALHVFSHTEPYYARSTPAFARVPVIIVYFTLIPLWLAGVVLSSINLSGKLELRRNVGSVAVLGVECVLLVVQVLLLTIISGLCVVERIDVVRKVKEARRLRLEAFNKLASKERIGLEPTIPKPAAMGV
ncbi:hypothetical protein FA15DRAFT_462662 [Coprinopsis marcescibilis]|uniref:Uncharacterized protein n=1 Tax=Coprinopsis marcescibilis TaxID=230819 RepID=A0A5C3KSD8_COPMA|nr:hypothetical protein FA15DRAFT_462662 [Coprinopsis marcescibilis]